MLKKYASTVNAIAIIFTALTVIAGIYLGIETESILPVLYTAIPAGVFYIFAKAFSELLYTTAENQEVIRNITDMLKKSNAKAPAETEKKMHVTPAAVPAQTKAEAVEAKKTNTPINSAPFRTDEANADYIICNKCGTHQRSNRTVCFNCGEKFK